MVLDSPQSSLGELVFLSEVLVANSDFLCTTSESQKKLLKFYAIPCCVTVKVVATHLVPFFNANILL